SSRWRSRPPWPTCWPPSTTRARRTTWWSTCDCSRRATCSGRASSSSTSSRGGGRSRSSVSRRWSPCARRATTFTSSRWPRPSASPSRWSTWTAARAAPPTRTSSLRAPSPRCISSIGLDTTTSSTNRAGPGPPLPCLPSPLPGARHVQRFFVVVNGHISLPPQPPSRNLPHFIKGDAGGEPRVCVSLLCCCLPGCYVSGCPPAPPNPQVGSCSPSTCLHPSLPTRSSFEGARPPGDPSWLPASFLQAPIPLPSLAGPGASTRILEVPWGLAQGPRTAQASSCSLLGPDSTLLPWSGPET
uniref:Uncharacterized protein n=1 Tax=Ursus maritimus TaxID=29073 RepID=A0A452SY75_URSMA